MEQEKKNEGGVEAKEINITKNEFSGGSEFNGPTFDENQEKDRQNRIIKNLFSLVVVLAGIAVGSIFVDVVQFLTKSGYSARALKNAEVFESDGKTWVSYEDPILEIKVLGVNNDMLKECPKCDPTEILKWMKKFVPTMVAKEIDYDSAEGKQLVEKYGISSIPAFIFDEKVKDSSFYNEGGASSIFDEKDGKFVLNTSALGAPVGKYLKMPEISEDDKVFGNKDAALKVIIFGDFQCPYSKAFYEAAMKVFPDYKDKIAFVQKNLPLSFHSQARNAAMAALCAGKQGRYWEMATALYANQQTWGTGKDFTSFVPYAKQIGLNLEQFNQCGADADFKDKISTDENLAKEFGISGTPSGFIGESFVGGAMKEADIKKMLDDELAKISK